VPIPGRARRPTPEEARRRRLAVTLGALVVAVALAVVVGDRRNDDEGPMAVADATTSTAMAQVAGSTTTAPHSPTVVADPLSLTVLVNKVWRLPPGWEPPDLVVPAVPFTFPEDDPKRQLRAPAARALEELFGAAEAAGTPLAAVSGYRSEATQAELFDQAVEEDGEAEAERRQARPGHSEHQTGLAMDVTTADGACPAEACFGLTPAAAWLAAHAAEHGFVVRYPADGEARTGYAFEPWHLRYVGVGVATRLTRDGLVLEELPG
jgi:D-alanyl-D-alanine carboxypeptidase